MISSKDNLILTSISPFYYKTTNIDKILPIFTGESKISLRILDWFVTNYSKKYNIIFKKDKAYNNIYLNYKSQLKAYSKKQFDPFCRRERITYYYNEDKYIITTVGQLNFFKWVLENNIIEYIEKNLTDIENDMNNTKIIISGEKKINKNKLEITITFD